MSKCLFHDLPSNLKVFTKSKVFYHFDNADVQMFKTSGFVIFSVGTYIVRVCLGSLISIKLKGKKTKKTDQTSFTYSITSFSQSNVLPSGISRIYDDN